jgi:hypothetical protein
MMKKSKRICIYDRNAEELKRQFFQHSSMQLEIQVIRANFKTIKKRHTGESQCPEKSRKY